MKPGEHPEFFRLPAPPGRSRESTIRLDASGTFWHDGARVEHAAMARAFATWIDRHPDDGRFILNNGYDWTYFTVADVPFFVEGLRLDGEGATLLLSDGSEEPLDAESLSVGQGDAVFVRVKQGRFEARFRPQAQTALMPLLEPGPEGEPEILLGSRRFSIGKRPVPA